MDSCWCATCCRLAGATRHRKVTMLITPEDVYLRGCDANLLAVTNVALESQSFASSLKLRFAGFQALFRSVQLARVLFAFVLMMSTRDSTSPTG